MWVIGSYSCGGCCFRWLDQKTEWTNFDQMKDFMNASSLWCNSSLHRNGARVAFENALKCSFQQSTKNDIKMKYSFLLLSSWVFFVVVSLPYPGSLRLDDVWLLTINLFKEFLLSRLHPQVKSFHVLMTPLESPSPFASGIITYVKKKSVFKAYLSKKVTFRVHVLIDDTNC